MDEDLYSNLLTATNNLGEISFTKYATVTKLNDNVCDCKETDSLLQHYNVPILDGLSLGVGDKVVIGFVNNSLYDPIIIGAVGNDKVKNAHTHDDRYVQQGNISGGTNLLGQWDSNSTANSPVTQTNEMFHNDQVLKINNSSNTDSSKYTDIRWQIPYNYFSYNDVFTLSFWAKGTNNAQIQTYFDGTASGYIKAKRLSSNSTVSGNNTESSSFNDGITTFALGSDWQFYTVTYQLNSSGTTNIDKFIRIRGRNSVNCYVACAKLERGFNSTDFSNGSGINSIKIDPSAKAKNLNDYVETGFYYNNSNTECANISNLPVSNRAFFLVVENWEANSGYTKQTCTVYSPVETYVRIKNNGTWGAWKKLLSIDDASTVTPVVDTTKRDGIIGTSTNYARADHQHTKTWASCNGETTSANYINLFGFRLTDSWGNRPFIFTLRQRGKDTPIYASVRMTNTDISQGNYSVASFKTWGADTTLYIRQSDINEFNIIVYKANNDTFLITDLYSGDDGFDFINLDTTYGSSAPVSTTENPVIQNTYIAGATPFGTSANTVCEGNDSRLSDARTPTVTTITTNIDLNDCKTVGFYQCLWNATARTISNTPPKWTYAFSLVVERTTSAGYVQTITAYDPTKPIHSFKRTCYNGTWGNWHRVSAELYNSSTASSTSGTGSSGYLKILQIKINTTYYNIPLTFKINQKTNKSSMCSIKFASKSGDQEIESFTYDGDPITAYLHNVDTNTWDLYIQKRGTDDKIELYDFHQNYEFTMGKFSYVLYNDVEIAEFSLPTTNLIKALPSYAISGETKEFYDTNTYTITGSEISSSNKRKIAFREDIILQNGLDWVVTGEINITGNRTMFRLQNPQLPNDNWYNYIAVGANYEGKLAFWWCTSQDGGEGSQVYTAEDIPLNTWNKFKIEKSGSHITYTFNNSITSTKNLTYIASLPYLQPNIYKYGTNDVSVRNLRFKYQ